MGAHHFFVSPTDIHDGVVELTGPEAHHAARVLRVHPGEAITVADGSGRMLEAVVVEADDVVRAEVRSVREAQAHKPAITLYQAIAKGDRMDDVVEKGVEVGVVRVVPFVAERTVVRWDESKRRKAHDRWEAVARTAGKQSRSPYLTQIEDVRYGVSAALDEDALVIVLHETATMRLRDALPSEAPDEIVIVVGPEGGFARSEVELLRLGAVVATLGSRILRTATAGPIAAAIVGYAYGTLG